MISSFLRVLAASAVAMTLSIGSMTEPGAVAAPTTGSIIGHVTLGDPTHFAGAGEVRITARQSVNDFGISALTGGDGSYSIAGLSSGRYFLQFDYIGTGGYADEWWPNLPIRDPNRGFAVDGSTFRADASLARGATISGTLTDTSGALLDGIEVRAYAWGDWAGKTELGMTTSAHGHYSISNLPVDDYTIEFFNPGGIGAPNARPYGSDPLHVGPPLVVAEGQETTGIDAVFYHYATLNGTVSCATCDMARLGELFRLSTVLEIDTSSTSTPHWVGAPASGPGLLHSEADPHASGYSFYGLLPGRYRMAVWYGETQPTTRVSDFVEFALDENEAATVDRTIRLRAAGWDLDLTGDGGPDVIARNSSGSLLVYPGTGSSSVGVPRTIGTGWSSANLILTPGDFSGDGIPDLIARSTKGNLYLYRGNGSGGIASATLLGTGWQNANLILTPGDFSGDGIADLIARSAKGNLYLYRGNGSGGIASTTLLSTGWQNANVLLAPGDFSGDGKPDLMARSVKGNLYLYRGDGAGSIAATTLVGTGWQNATAFIAPGDFTNDGKPDLIVRSSKGDLFLYRGAGTGSFYVDVYGSIAQRIGTGWNGFNAILGSADYDGDGIPDLLARSASGDAFVYANNSMGALKPPVRVGRGWNSLTLVP